MTIILEKYVRVCVPNSNTINRCGRGNSCAPVSTTLPLYMAAVLMMWYI